MTVKEDYKKSLKELYESLPENTQQWVHSEVSKIRKVFILWFLFLFFSLTSVCIFVYKNPLEEQLGIWIQRSGSLLSLIAVIAEVLFIAKLNQLVRISHWAKLSCEVYVERKYKSLLRFTIITTIFLVSFGTIVWGYGDLLYKFSVNISYYSQ